MQDEIGPDHDTRQSKGKNTYCQKSLQRFLSQVTNRGADTKSNARHLVGRECNRERKTQKYQYWQLDKVGTASGKGREQVGHQGYQEKNSLLQSVQVLHPVALELRLYSRGITKQGYSNRETYTP